VFSRVPGDGQGSGRGSIRVAEDAGKRHEPLSKRAVVVPQSDRCDFGQPRSNQSTSVVLRQSPRERAGGLGKLSTLSHLTESSVGPAGCILQPWSTNGIPKKTE
jgi:hypothetical protein